MKNNSAILGMIFGAGIGIIFGSTGLGLPMGAGVGLVIGMMIENQKKKINIKKEEVGVEAESIDIKVKKEKDITEMNEIIKINILILK